MKISRYVDEVCLDCATANNASMPLGHLATYYEGICECCALWKVLCSARDLRYPKIQKLKLTQKNKDKILSELNAVKAKYLCEANAIAVDEIDSQISYFSEEAS